MINQTSLLILASFILSSCTNIADTSKYKPVIISDYTEYRSDHHPKTQQQAAESLLKVIHRFKDNKVVLSVHENLYSSNGAEITVYRYYSDWYGDWLISFIMLEDGYKDIELRSATTADRISKESEFYQNVINLANKMTQLTPNTSFRLDFMTIITPTQDSSSLPC
ncbi:MAG: hypothetical protein ACSHX0_12880 [Akkermansiaceae bacterium]